MRPYAISSQTLTKRVQISARFARCIVYRSMSTHTYSSMRTNIQQYYEETYIVGSRTLRHLADLCEMRSFMQDTDVVVCEDTQ